MKTLKILAPGKINLTLEVLRKRADGFHDIRSLMVPVGLADELLVEVVPSSVIEITSDSSAVPCDETNLVHRAAVALRKHAGVGLGCRVHIKKRIPIGAGMGGGSSDAASALMALNELWQLKMDRTTLASIGADLGSDIPFFLWPGAAVVAGRGEQIERIDMKWHGWAGLVSSGDHVSTADVYAACKPRGDDRSPNAERAITECETADDITPLLHNDLESSVYEIAPSVERLRMEMIHEGLAGGTLRVTGAGSVMFELFDHEILAKAFAVTVMDCPSARNAWSVQIPAPAYR